ncbi:MAG: aminotransferase class I/II-fold pyridoxal phosphate-dependent enzyme [Melioribacteraceae bacterium]|nr:aminotransferase class I/II-fold pyridoxal phosphate-dependent enzyme [Melioribacteraceae bacterium]
MSINDIKYCGGENFDLRQILLNGRTKCLNDRTKYFEKFIHGLVKRKEMQHLRIISSAADRKVIVKDLYSGELKEMLMFGSNNYLGLSNNPYVVERTGQTLRKYGAGIGGPPLLNGYTILHQALEERLANMKKSEGALIFSSGYGANVGLLSSLINRGDIVIHDAYSHASFTDGIKMASANSLKFPHNDLQRLKELLSGTSGMNSGDVFVGVEGVYSMDGDTAPLDKIVPLCKSKNSILIVDDAHGTGIMGPTGKGTAEHYGVEENVDITMGTFSKVFSVTGGFVTASKSIINYLRFFARSYMFSASLSPVTIATVLAGLDVIEKEKGLLESFKNNVNYIRSGLQKQGFNIVSTTGVFPLMVPEHMNIRIAAYEFHKRGIFLNSIEYPAVPVSQQRFRLSIMASHTKEDIDRLLGVIEEVWSLFPETDYKNQNNEAA